MCAKCETIRQRLDARQDALIAEYDRLDDRDGGDLTIEEIDGRKQQINDELKFLQDLISDI